MHISTEAPWSLKKTDTERMNTVLYNLCISMKSIALLLQPFMPQSCAKILDQLSVPGSERDFTFISHEIPVGTRIPEPKGIFPRIQPAEQAA